jgi:putative acetyltransferase
VELEVYTDNERAIGLYEKYGFDPEGIKRKNAVRNGRYADVLMMARIRGE